MRLGLVSLSIVQWTLFSLLGMERS